MVPYRRLIELISNKSFSIINRLLIFPIQKIRFKEFGYLSRVENSILLTPSCIEIGKKVIIRNNSRIEGVFKYGLKSFSPNIVFQDQVSVQQNLHLTCANSVEIGENTAIGANVTITDIHHPYDNIEVPIEMQDIICKSVQIGRDCKIYNNVVILPGVKIGKHVTIGANSVVNKNIPDYCVAVGSPAKIVKRYCFVLNQWRPTNKLGEFIKI